MGDILDFIDTWEIAVSIQNYNTSRLQKLKRQRLEMKLEAIEYKGGKCVDCDGIFHHAAMEFHHLGNKKFSLHQAMNRSSLKFIKPELNKCVLLCSNCHQIRHYKEQQRRFLLANPPLA